MLANRAERTQRSEHLEMHRQRHEGGSVGADVRQFVLSECEYLVVHEGDERRHHQANTPRDERRQLKTEALAGARGHGHNDWRRKGEDKGKHIERGGIGRRQRRGGGAVAAA